MDAAWALADIAMGCMTIINLPCCVALSGLALKALKDYEEQKKQGKIQSSRQIPLDFQKKSGIIGDND